MVLTLIELVGPMIVISTLSRVLAAVAIWVAVTGTLSSELFPGRLEGTFPPIHPNDIAFEAAVPLVYFVWRTVNVDTSFVRLLTLIPLGVIIFLTQSRTTEAMTAMVVLSLIIRGTRHERFRLSVTTAAVVCVVFAVNFTDTIQHFGSRGGTSEIGSFGDRIIAWNTVLNMTRPPMQTLFGQGLTNKFFQ